MTTFTPRRLLTISCLALLYAGAVWGQEGTADRAQILHVLNRITFGPRPGDVDMVQKMGLHNYIESQLHPETIDDSAVDQVVAQFEMLQMTSPQLMGLYRDEREKARQKREAKEAALKQSEAGQGTATKTDLTATPDMTSITEAKPKMYKVLDGQNPTETSSDMTAPATREGKLAKMTEVANEFRSIATIGQLEQAKLVRAVDSQRQLQEVLVDFWGNHFNIDVKKHICGLLKVADDKDTIRPHIWGKFRDLLEASATSPAMLVYLDNAQNSKPPEASGMAPQMQVEAMKPMTEETPAAVPAPATILDKLKKRQGGINENYAREIMELHTLGVDGGYTQQDVQEVARCFTGWSIKPMTGEFVFRSRQHDDGVKVVLGHTIPARGGMKDGEMVLDILASSPACAHFISYKLCQRFIGDTPPASVVDRTAAVFRDTDGDLRQVTEAILTSPEFNSPASYGNKIKSPLEFTVSAVRASDSTLIAKRPAPFDRIVPAMEGAAVTGRGNAVEKVGRAKRQSLNWHILELGEPLFACTPPTGYKEESGIWVSPGALIERLNFAMALTQQQVSDVHFDSSKILAGIDLDKPDAVLDQCVAVLLQNNITETTRKVLEQTALPPPGENKTVDPAKLIALMIGSPEFQRK